MRIGLWVPRRSEDQAALKIGSVKNFEHPELWNSHLLLLGDFKFGCCLVEFTTGQLGIGWHIKWPQRRLEEWKYV